MAEPVSRAALEEASRVMAMTPAERDRYALAELKRRMERVKKAHPDAPEDEEYAEAIRVLQARMQPTDGGNSE